MARPLRLEFPGAVWHLTSRGNERREIFRDDEDRSRFVSRLGRTAKFFRWRLHAYVLMGNHYHLLVETPEANLSLGMRQLNGTYTQDFNRRHRRVGHLMQGRFKGILVEKESHLLELVRYVVLNPVRAGLVKSPRHWRWSNYSMTAGLATVPDWLEVDWTLDQFSKKPTTARRLYQKFVAEGKGVAYHPWEEVSAQVYLGGKQFGQRLQALIDSKRRSPEIPRKQREPGRPSLSDIAAATAEVFGMSAEQLRSGRGGFARTIVAYLAREEGAISLRTIGEALRISSPAVSRLAALGQRLRENDPKFRQVMEKAGKGLLVK